MLEFSPFCLKIRWFNTAIFLHNELPLIILVSGFVKEEVIAMNIIKTLFCVFCAISVCILSADAEAETNQNAKETISIPRSRSGGSGMTNNIEIKRSKEGETSAGMASLNPKSLSEKKGETVETKEIPLSRSGGSQGSDKIEIKK